MTAMSTRQARRRRSPSRTLRQEFSTRCACGRYNVGEYADDPWSGLWTDDVLIGVADEPDATPTPSPLPRGTITGLTASSPDPGALTVAWDVPTPAASDHRVVWHKVGDPTPSWRDTDRNACTASETHTITGLAEDAEYRLSMAARYGSPDHGYWSGPWTDATARVSCGLPGQITGLMLVEFDDPICRTHAAQQRGQSAEVNRQN